MNTIQNQIDTIFRMTRGMIIFRAIVMLIIGAAMFFAPLQTLWWMTIIIGAIVMADGIILLSDAIQSDDELRGVMIVNAILLIILGIFSLSAPLMMDMIWVMLLGIWALGGRFSGRLALLGERRDVARIADVLPRGRSRCPGCLPPAEEVDRPKRAE